MSNMETNKMSDRGLETNKMSDRGLEVTITVNGVERTYKGDYHELHKEEWSDVVRLLLDEAHQYEEEEL